MMDDIQMPMCCNCKEKSNSSLSCTAYPLGIPDEILYSIWDHREPQLGDGGIQYDPIDPDYELPDFTGDGEMNGCVVD